MKKIFLVFGLLVLSGCGNPSSGSKEQESNVHVDSEKINAAAIGEMCGGIAGIQCGPKLECKLDGYYPDASGTCIDSVVDPTVKCPQYKSPVCAVKDRMKNGYLNKCEAERHGALVLEKGLCQKDPSVISDCEAKVLSVGNCAESFTGFEFDDGDCKELTVLGCDAEIPFETLVECRKQCGGA